MANFLNTDGLSALWAKIKSKFYTKAEVDAAIPNASTTTPLMDGTAATGSSTNYARADHVHPSDTSKANVADVLGKTNTTSYTPTADYNPATKKYVDDSIPVVSPINSVQNGSILLNDNSSSLSPKINTALKFRDGSLIIGANDWDDEGDDVSGYLTIIGGGTHGHITNLKPTYTGGTSIDINLPASAGTLALTSDILSNLSELSDTAISSPSNGQVLQYNATNNTWVNGDASDVLYVTVTGNQNDGFATTASFDDVYAAYQNGCDIKAVNGSEVYNLSTASASGMAFTKNSTSIIKQLTWSKSTGNINYTSWTASSISVSSLNDTTISSPSDGQVLTYDSASSKWINSDSNEILYATITGNASDGYSIDKTFTEMQNALNNGKQVIAINSGYYYYCTWSVGSYILLSSQTLYATSSPHIGFRVFTYKNDGTLTYYSSSLQNQIANFNISSPTEGQVLSYDATNSQWINTNVITETRVNELIAAALAQYGDGDVASYGYTNASEVNY